MAWLDSLRNSSDEERLLLRVARRGTRGLSIRRLMAETGLPSEAAERLLQPLIISHRLFQIPGEILVASPALEAACKAHQQPFAAISERPQTIGAEDPDFARPGGPRFRPGASCRAQKLRLKGELVCPPETGRGSAALRMQLCPQSRRSIGRLDCLLPRSLR